VEVQLHSGTQQVGMEFGLTNPSKCVAKDSNNQPTPDIPQALKSSTDFNSKTSKRCHSCRLHSLSLIITEKPTAKEECK
jgi:hypothetical protein